MTKDKALEDVFLSHRPVFDDRDEFMHRLEQKLDAVEYVRRYEEARLRRYRWVLALALALALAFGGALFVFMLGTPLEVSLGLADGLLAAVLHNSRLLAAIALMLFLAYAVIAIAGNILDIWSERSRLREKDCKCG